MGSDSSFGLSRVGSISLARIEQCHAQDGYFQTRYPASFASSSGARTPLRSQELRCHGDELHGAALRLLPSTTLSKSDMVQLRAGNLKMINRPISCQVRNADFAQKRRSASSCDSSPFLIDDGNWGPSSNMFMGTTRKSPGQKVKLHGSQMEKHLRKLSPPGRRDLNISAAATADSGQSVPSQNGGGEKPLPTKPHPEVHPAEVVLAQLKALREKDLATVFEFASPNNKARTGPLSRFSEMLEGRAYNVMIGHIKAEVLSTITISENRFQQRIVIEGTTGKKATFQWSLSRQEEGPFASCWMTDAVRRDE
ncbi:hypothetical protein R1sor_006854 [Riccia sorocarpa]|uniref:DUF4440 domain-containing protein n=1 Tax=Riccia sorocarpa TaxID=122646 RepID=A0ABD3HP44_9MARC